MIKVETINYQEKIYDNQFVSKCMAGRTAQVTHHISKDAKVLFSIKTRKNYKDDYISISIRTEESFRGLANHIQSQYGGYIIPKIAHKSIAQNVQEGAKCYQNYLNALIIHRIIRSDPILFSFCFLQQKQGTHQSKYQRFLNNALNFSRKHLSKLLTRQDFDQHSQKDQQLQVYKKEALIKRDQFSKLHSKIIQVKEQKQCLYNISQLLLLQKSQNQSYSISLDLETKCQKINTIFDEIDQAYNRRLIVLQRIKQLKANNIRHKYSSKNQSNQKLLEIQRAKHKTWSQTLCQQMECMLVILDSLIKQIISKYFKLQKMSYEDILQN